MLSRLVSRVKWSIILAISVIVALTVMLPLVAVRALIMVPIETFLTMVKIIGMMIDDCREGIHEGDSDD